MDPIPGVVNRCSVEVCQLVRSRTDDSDNFVWPFPWGFKFSSYRRLRGNWLSNHVVVDEKLLDLDLFAKISHHFLLVELSICHSLAPYLFDKIVVELEAFKGSIRVESLDAWWHEIYLEMWNYFYSVRHSEGGDSCRWSWGCPLCPKDIRKFFNPTTRFLLNSFLEPL